jgi:hypothetical protein
MYPLFRNHLFYNGFFEFDILGISFAYRVYTRRISSLSRMVYMTNFIKIGIFFVVLGLVPIFSVLAGETMKELPGKSLQATPSSTGSNILEGKLLKIEGDFWMVEDLSGNQHQIHIGAETQLPQSPKQTGDSIQAVVRKDGHASFIQ